jgi:hypothetical protein
MLERRSFRLCDGGILTSIRVVLLELCVFNDCI